MSGKKSEEKKREIEKKRRFKFEQHTWHLSELAALHYNTLSELHGCRWITTLPTVRCLTSSSLVQRVAVKSSKLKSISSFVFSSLHKTLKQNEKRKPSFHRCWATIGLAFSLIWTKNKKRSSGQWPLDQLRQPILLILTPSKLRSMIHLHERTPINNIYIAGKSILQKELNFDVLTSKWIWEFWVFNWNSKKFVLVQI